MTETFKPTLGAGNVKIIIDGEHLELVPSYAAMVACSARGGLRGAMERILSLDAETIIEVVKVGLGYGPGQRPPADFAERIWRSGFTLSSGGIANAAFTYVNVLANGGRPTPEEAGVDADVPPLPVTPPAGAPSP